MNMIQVLNRSDGGIELRRLLNDDALQSWAEHNPLSFEKSIVWFQPLDGLDFVRVATVHNARSRRGTLACPNMIVLGYSKLTADAPRNPATGAYTRRLFYLKPTDADLNMNEVPDGAIDPGTIRPGGAGSPPHLSSFDRGYPAHLRRGTRSDKALAPRLEPSAVA